MADGVSAPVCKTHPAVRLRWRTLSPARYTPIENKRNAAGDPEKLKGPNATWKDGGPWGATWSPASLCSRLSPEETGPAATGTWWSSFQLPPGPGNRRWELVDTCSIRHLTQGTNSCHTFCAHKTGAALRLGTPCSQGFLWVLHCRAEPRGAGLPTPGPQTASQASSAQAGAR